jgi:hypothetical protein
LKVVENAIQARTVVEASDGSETGTFGKKRGLQMGYSKRDKAETN